VNPIALILASGVLGVAGQFVLKRTVTQLGPLSLNLESLPELLLQLATNPGIIAGLAVYASGTMLWLVALSKVDLSYAYPFASLNYVLVFAVSWLVLGEQQSISRAAGVVAICIGVWAISRTPARSVAPTLARVASIDGQTDTALAASAQAHSERMR
jgi:multidrug transporter EmrE-like cation transporter